MAVTRATDLGEGQWLLDRDDGDPVLMMAGLDGVSWVGQVVSDIDSADPVAVTLLLGELVPPQAR